MLRVVLSQSRIPQRAACRWTSSCAKPAQSLVSHRTPAARLIPVALSPFGSNDQSRFSFRFAAALLGVAASGITVAFCENSSSQPNAYSWGYNLQGQLGLGNELERIAVPTLIQELRDKKIVKLVCGGNSTAAVTVDGEVYTWGFGEKGRLGLGDEANRNIPTLVEDLNDTKIIDIAVGGVCMAAVSQDGHVYAWGDRHCTGVNARRDMFKPVKVEALGAVRIVGIACGYEHVAAFDEHGRLFTWGAGYEGQLGHGTKNNEGIPKFVEGLANHRVVQVACGRNFTMALCDDGSVHTFGSSSYGQLGHGRLEQFQRTPREIRILKDKKVVSITAGEYHAAALLADGSVYTWGYGKEGQVGHGNTSDQNTPKPVESLKEVKIVQVACGGGHTAVLTDTGDLYTFGRGRDGQLGRGQTLESMAAYRTEPVLVQALTKRVMSVTCGSDHTAAVARM